jgi:hypothetical protein
MAAEWGIDRDGSVLPERVLPWWLVLWITGACTVMTAAEVLAVWAFAFGRPDAAWALLVGALLAGLAMCAGIDLIPHCSTGDGQEAS